MTEITRYELKSRLHGWLQIKFRKIFHYDDLLAIIDDIIDYMEMAGMVILTPEILEYEHVNAAVERIDKDDCGSEAECNTRSYGYEKFCEYQEKKEQAFKKYMEAILKVSIESDKNNE